jgi:uncharacterized repeat protein (TIGR02543 family)
VADKAKTKTKISKKEKYFYLGFSLFLIVGCLLAVFFYTSIIPVERHTITFNTDGGSEVYSVRIFNKRNLQQPTIPTKEGYEFVGWFNNGQPVTFPLRIEYSKILRARWIAIEDSDNNGNGANGNDNNNGSPVIELIALTFNSNGGNAIGARSLTLNAKYDTLPTPIRTGHIFDGWFFVNGVANGLWGEEVTTETTVTNENAHTLFARWIAEIYTITYRDLGNATFSGAFGANFPNSHTFGAITNLITPTRTGYILYGWFTDADGNTEAITSLSATGTTSNITLYAEWLPISYTIIYHANNGTEATISTSHLFDVDKNLAISTFTFGGFAFTGWNTQPNGAGVGYADGQPVLNLTSQNDVTINLFAIWAANLNTVVFNQNGGSGSMLNQTLLTGQTAYLRTNTFTRTGFNFAGWATASGDFYANTASFTMTSSDTIILYAVWTARNDIHLTFNSNGGNNITGRNLTFNAQYGTLTPPTKDGFDFNGWFTLDGTISGDWGESVTATTTVNNAENHTLFARWTPKTSSITYHDIGNTTFSGAHGANRPTSHIFSTTTNLVEPTRAGFIFGGWFTTSNGSGEAITELNPTEFTTTINLFAKWIELNINLFYGNYQLTDTITVEIFDYATEHYSVYIVGIINTKTGLVESSSVERRVWADGVGWIEITKISDNATISNEQIDFALAKKNSFGSTLTIAETTISFGNNSMMYNVSDSAESEEYFAISIRVDGLNDVTFRTQFNKSSKDIWIWIWEYNDYDINTGERYRVIIRMDMVK